MTSSAEVKENQSLEMKVKKIEQSEEEEEEVLGAGKASFSSENSSSDSAISVGSDAEAISSSSTSSKSSSSSHRDGACSSHTSSRANSIIVDEPEITGGKSSPELNNNENIGSKTASKLLAAGSLPSSQTQGQPAPQAYYRANRQNFAPNSRWHNKQQSYHKTTNYHSNDFQSRQSHAPPGNHYPQHVAFSPGTTIYATAAQPASDTSLIQYQQPQQYNGYSETGLHSLRQHFMPSLSFSVPPPPPSQRPNQLIYDYQFPYYQQAAYGQPIYYLPVAAARPAPMVQYQQRPEVAEQQSWQQGGASLNVAENCATSCCQEVTAEPLTAVGAVDESSRALASSDAEDGTGRRSARVKSASPDINKSEESNQEQNLCSTAAHEERAIESGVGEESNQITEGVSTLDADQNNADQTSSSPHQKTSPNADPSWASAEDSQPTTETTGYTSGACCADSSSTTAQQQELSPSSEVVSDSEVTSQHRNQGSGFQLTAAERPAYMMPPTPAYQLPAYNPYPLQYAVFQPASCAKPLLASYPFAPLYNQPQAAAYLAADPIRASLFAQMAASMRTMPPAMIPAYQPAYFPAPIQQQQQQGQQAPISTRSHPAYPTAQALCNSNLCQHHPNSNQNQHQHQQELGQQPPEARRLEALALLPISAEPTKTRQAYGMDKVWLDEFDQLFCQFSSIGGSEILWTLAELESNPTINESRRILGYRGRFIVDCSLPLSEEKATGEEAEKTDSSLEGERKDVEVGQEEEQAKETELDTSSGEQSIESGCSTNSSTGGTSTRPANRRAAGNVLTRFRMFIDSAKVRFCCDSCGHGWTSMKGRVVFWYELFELSNNQEAPPRLVGYCAYKLFGQQCDICKIENRFERPMWYPEEVSKVLNNLYNKIGQIYFGLRLPSIDKQRRAGKPKTSHNSSLCQACHDGLCTDRK